ncbi:hypothetical protein CPLU01_05123 [Colletotrichum plurivorum]|uniref:Uncharacterized protein n=1 Tax=Colletotrichum plurivorum TaxID=2175906 RepID=A0A8H6KMP0_9PEZI|nr:hypothetical protein CPLU01_05123 [Colletotrichum plurivorum]
MKKKKKKVEPPVRRPSTPTPTTRPKARPQTGTRSSPLSIQQRSKSQAAVLADRSRATIRVLHSRASRISIINQGGICGFFGKPRRGRIL